MEQSSIPIRLPVFFSDCVMSMLAFGTKENKDAHSFVTSSFLIQDRLVSATELLLFIGKTVDICHSF